MLQRLQVTKPTKPTSYRAYKLQRLQNLQATEPTSCKVGYKGYELQNIHVTNPLQALVTSKPVQQAKKVETGGIKTYHLALERGDLTSRSPKHHLNLQHVTRFTMLSPTYPISSVR